MTELNKKDYWDYFRELRIGKNVGISLPYKETFFGFSSPIFNFSIGKWYVIVRFNKIIYARGEKYNLNVKKTLIENPQNCVFV